RRSRERPMPPANTPSTNAPHIAVSPSAASRASVAAIGLTASSSKLDVNASGCSCRPRSRNSRYTGASAGVSRRIVNSDDLEVTLELPIGHAVEPLPPFPFARRGEVIDEFVTEKIARDVRFLEDARGLDQRARRARNVLRALVGP